MDAQGQRGVYRCPPVVPVEGRFQGDSSVPAFGREVVPNVVDP